MKIRKGRVTDVTSSTYIVGNKELRKMSSSGRAKDLDKKEPARKLNITGV